MSPDNNYNFNDPLDLTVIFREPIYEKGDKDEMELPQELADELGIQTMTSKVTGYNEYSGNISILWRDIMCIKSYPYKDNWKQFKGDKFYVGCYNLENDYLVFGDLRQMKEYWTVFRRKEAEE